jgi:hypothetical protein
VELVGLSKRSGGLKCHEEIKQVPWGWVPERAEQLASAPVTQSPDLLIRHRPEAHLDAVLGAARAAGVIDTGTTPPG